jgi:hypothetical protein
MAIESGSVWTHARSRAFVPPSLDLENVGSGNVCCNKGDVYVVKKPKSAPPAAKYSFDQRKITLCDCRGASFSAKATEGKTALFQDLMEKYGALQTAAAFRLVGVRTVNAITVEELFTVTQYLEETKSHEREVQQLIKGTANWTRYEAVGENIELGGEATFVPDQYEVQKDRGGQRAQPFDVAKIRRDLELTEYETEINPTELDKVIETVGKIIAKRSPPQNLMGPKIKLDASSIRTLVCSELKRRRIQVKKPDAFLALNAGVQTQLSQVEYASDISEDLYTKLVQARIGNFQPKDFSTENSKLLDE